MTIKENGELGDHTADPSYYYKPIPSTALAYVGLTFYALDDQPISPNYNAITGLPNTLAVLSSLPPANLCQLYYMNGTLIQSSGAIIAYNYTTQAYSLRIRPPYNMISSPPSQPVCYFTFSALNVKYNSLSLVPATISVIVTQVNKPPIANTNLASVLADTYNILTLTGTVTNAALYGGYIVGLPKYGSLYAVYPNRSIALTPIILTAQRPSYYVNMSTPLIAYRYTGSQTVVDQLTFNGVLNSDRFMFTVQDVNSRQSLSAQYNITVDTALAIVPTLYGSAVASGSPIAPAMSRFVCLENTLCAIPLQARDNSLAGRNVTIIITRCVRTYPTYFLP